jgi:hypothetical protein
MSDPAGFPHDELPPASAGGEAAPARDTRPRPLIERIGMAAIALVLGLLFAVVAIASFAGGEPFLGVMGVIGTLMVFWVGGLTLVRG